MGRALGPGRRPGPHGRPAIFTSMMKGVFALFPCLLFFFCLGKNRRTPRIRALRRPNVAGPRFVATREPRAGLAMSRPVGRWNLLRAGSTS